MEGSQNYVELWGIAGSAPAFSHENHARRFDKFPLRVERLSGQSDVPVIVAGEALLRTCPVSEGQSLRVTGQLRSFNNKSGQGSKLVISVFARELSPPETPVWVNEVELTGTLCKSPNRRTTPMGREICDLMLAVNRLYGRSDYLPCIVWGQNARRAALWDVGTRVHLLGRIQSREYIKNLDGQAVRRTAYEISVSDIAALPAE